MVRCEKRANPLAEVYIHNRPSLDRGADRLREPRQNDSDSIDPRSSRNCRLSRRERSCPSDSLMGDRIDHCARAAPGMQAEKETVAGKRFHEPERRPPDAIVIVVDGRCDDRPVIDQRLPRTAQRCKLRSLKMQFDEGG